jgi:hypothetical protein
LIHGSFTPVSPPLASPVTAPNPLIPPKLAKLDSLISPTLDFSQAFFTAFDLVSSAFAVLAGFSRRALFTLPISSDDISFTFFYSDL